MGSNHKSGFSRWKSGRERQIQVLTDQSVLLYRRSDLREPLKGNETRRNPDSFLFRFFGKVLGLTHLSQANCQEADRSVVVDK